VKALVGLPKMFALPRMVHVSADGEPWRARCAVGKLPSTECVRGRPDVYAAASGRDNRCS
jgi:hypothetical protein